MADNTTPAIAEKPEAGKLSIDDKMRFGPVRLAYESARALALNIAGSVSKQTQGRTVVIAGTALLADYANLQAAMLSLHGLTREYLQLAKFARAIVGKPTPSALESAPGPETTAAPAAAAAAAVAATGNPLAAAALGALALLQKDVEFRGVETKVDRLAFELAVAAALSEGHAGKVFVPDLMLQPLPALEASSLRAALETVAEAKGAAWLAAAPLIRRALEAEAALDKAAAAKNEDEIKKRQAELDEARRNLEPLHTPLMQADRLFDDLQAHWRKVESGEALSTLARMLRIEAIEAMKPLYLHCAIVDSGGHHRLSRSLWNFLLADDGLSFSGGAVARWALLAADGAIEQGGLITAERNASSARQRAAFC